MSYCRHAYELFHDARLRELQDDRIAYQLLLCILAAHITECTPCRNEYTAKTHPDSLPPASSAYDDAEEYADALFESLIPLT